MENLKKISIILMLLLFEIKFDYFHNWLKNYHFPNKIERINNESFIAAWNVIDIKIVTVSRIELKRPDTLYKKKKKENIQCI